MTDGGFELIGETVHRRFALGRRAFVPKVDFVTTSGARVSRVITDKCILEKDTTGELVVAALYAGVTVDDVRRDVGWDLRVTASPVRVPAPSAEVLAALRALQDTP